MTSSPILLVDDSASDREMVLAVMRQCGLKNEVVALRDGAEALDYLYRKDPYAARQDVNPIVILLDLKMPRVDGLQVLREIKQDPKLKSIPVVVMTSSREESDLAKSYSLGVNAYVVKPLDFQEFVTSIKAVQGFWTSVNSSPPRTK